MSESKTPSSLSITNCVFGIQEKDKKILLVKNLYKEFGPIWGIPGGKQKPGESAQVTLKREFLEETKQVIEVGKFITVFERIQLQRPFHLLAPVFEITSKDSPLIPKNDIVIDYHYFSIEELKSNAETIMNREQLIQFLEDRHKVPPFCNLKSDLDSGPIS
ncbi:MAG: hypothetical protein COA79_11205 [Planctomycetota bacterium]|nr:MAG: hypothetical protein COA79_11205 [Planctomycetota bacterium]